MKSEKVQVGWGGGWVKKTLDFYPESGVRCDIVVNLLKLYIHPYFNPNHDHFFYTEPSSEHRNIF